MVASTTLDAHSPKSTAWLPDKTFGMLEGDQDIRYFHFGIKIPTTGMNELRRSEHPLPLRLPNCSFIAPVNEMSAYRSSLGQLATLFLRARYTAQAEVTPYVD